MNELIRTNIRSLYDHQKLRIQTGNRICAAFRVKLGLQSSEEEKEQDSAKQILDSLRREFRRITDGVKLITQKIQIDSPLISNYAELCLIEAYDHQLLAEQAYEKAILSALETEDIWTCFLLDVDGIGPLMAGVILSEIDPAKCNSISALHKYAGLDVVVTEQDGQLLEESRSRKRHHLVPKTYQNGAGEKVETMGITFNPFLKTKLIGVLGPSFLKQAESPYREIYLNYRRMRNEKSMGNRERVGWQENLLHRCTKPPGSRQDCNGR